MNKNNTKKEKKQSKKLLEKGREMELTKKAESKKLFGKKSFKDYRDQVLAGIFFEDINILQLANSLGVTIAHRQAERGWTTENTAILRWIDVDNATVAHIQAMNGWTTEDLGILGLVKDNGVSVAYYQIKRGWTTENIYILDMYYATIERLKENTSIARERNERMSLLGRLFGRRNK